MKSGGKIIAIFVLVIAIYYWFKRFDVLLHPEFYGELIVPVILTIIAGFLLVASFKRGKRK